LKLGIEDGGDVTWTVWTVAVGYIPIRSLSVTFTAPYRSGRGASTCSTKNGVI
jgi:hypothetical protein